ncbi:Fasciclin-like arabinogalactan protein 21 [Apostasia shenzhenica]|uniref:Fasciclin-like arabinogalactan protein 21 n=1 Tax=Apostasia shenzhenica TaxID=1088818 RepID=A0A2H9ZSV8_9ASPA|nr:Fasciclin-like arabinogalactan protein 21 [Apostasia shenzhenica]
MPGHCSHWWHALIHAAAAVTVIFAAISNTRQPPPTAPPDAITALRHAGFHVAAAVLQISPATIFLDRTAGGNCPTTLFVFPDGESVGNFSDDQLFRLHSIPLHLLLSYLRKLPRGSRLPTLLPGKTVLLSTGTSAGARAFAIGGASITQPDLFVNAFLVIHGVSAAFTPATTSALPLPSPPEASARWSQVVRQLGSQGYVSFAVGLSAVVNRVATAAAMVEEVTIFAPAGGGFDLAAGWPANKVESLIKRHVAVGRYDYRELVAMGVGEGLLTLAEN